MIRRTMLAFCVTLVAMAQSAMADSIETIAFGYSGGAITSNAVFPAPNGIFTDSIFTVATLPGAFNFAAPPATTFVTTPTVAYTGHFVSSSGNGVTTAYSALYIGTGVVSGTPYSISERLVLNLGGTSGTIELRNPPVPSAVPEPSTFALLGLGAVGLAVSAFRRRQAAV
jgi:hypothetical protein